MDIMGRIPAGTEKESAYPIKGPAFLTPWFSVDSNDYAIGTEKESVSLSQ